MKDKNPTVTFRLTPYQIARGLQIIRQFEPNYVPSTPNKIVKLLYLDYLAKMNINRSDDISLNILNEVNLMLNQNKNSARFKTCKKDLFWSNELGQFDISSLPQPKRFNPPNNLPQQNNLEPSKVQPFPILSNQEFDPIQISSESVISTVTDFSPPSDWMDD